jgi:hypothetical protein
MNVYSTLFANRLGFKNVATARHSVAVIDRFYRQFAAAGDRAGQHHALSMALVMFNRARWIGKGREADVFRQWLVKHLTQEPVVEADRPVSEAESTAGCKAGVDHESSWEHEALGAAQWPALPVSSS